jgi:formylmethanofuran dehydrogenase subunit B
MAAATRTTEDVVCPFCSLACDDLVIEAEGAALRMRAPSCPIAEREFARPVPPDARPAVRGEPATLDEAVAHAADLLARSRLPLFAGLGTDVAGMRAVLALAERTGGIVDHAGSRGLMANVRAMQDGGWVTATLAEIRNRADLVLFVGTDSREVAPRFVERCLAPSGTLFGPLARELVYLGDGLDPADGVGTGFTSLPCAPERLPEAVAGLQALLAGNRLSAATVGGVPAEALRALADRLRSARYPVVVWAAGETAGGHPDLLVGALAGLLREVNAKTRCAGLPLAGPDNVIGCNQVCAWQTGVPLRTSFAASAPDHDPARWSTEALLAGRAVDCLVWIASLREQRVPATAVPTIALLRPGLPAAPAAEVTIPVGAPGLDHGGSAYRTDSVVAVPLAALRDPVAPSVASVLADIGERSGRRPTA